MSVAELDPREENSQHGAFDGHPVQLAAQAAPHRRYGILQQHVRHAYRPPAAKVFNLRSHGQGRRPLRPPAGFCPNHFPLMISDICASLMSYRKKVE